MFLTYAYHRARARGQLKKLRMPMLSVRWVDPTGEVVLILNICFMDKFWDIYKIGLISEVVFVLRWSLK